MRAHGAWETWLDFFLEGIDVAGREAIDCARAAFSLVSRHERELLDSEDATLTAVRALRLLPRHPIVSARALSTWLEVSRPTATKCIATLEALGILAQIGQNARDRTYHYTDYLEILRQDEADDWVTLSETR